MISCYQLIQTDSQGNRKCVAIYDRENADEMLKLHQQIFSSCKYELQPHW